MAVRVVAVVECFFLPPPKLPLPLCCSTDVLLQTSCCYAHDFVLGKRRFLGPLRIHIIFIYVN